MKLNYFSISSLAFLLFLLLSIGVALSATNSVSTSGLSDQTINITANDLKPTECASLNLTNIQIVTAGVPLTSTRNSNDLIFGTSGADDITAGKGQDCVLGGAGDDILNGDQGGDILLGGAGNDTIDGGPGTDICYSGGGTDTFARCETIR